MQGEKDNPGIVQRTVRDIFQAIEDTPDREFLLRFSMLEIYNEVCAHSAILSCTKLPLEFSMRYHPSCSDPPQEQSHSITLVLLNTLDLYAYSKHSLPAVVGLITHVCHLTCR